MSEAVSISLPKAAYVDGEWRDWDNANVPISAHALHYGTGSFGGIRCFWDEESEEMRAFRLPLHKERLKYSMRLFRMEKEEEIDKLDALLGELIARNGWRDDIYVRPLLYKGNGPSVVGVNPIRNKDCFAMFGLQFGMNAYYSQDKLYKLYVSKEHVQLPTRAIPRDAKITGAYANSVLALYEAFDNGCDDVLLQNAYGNITEAHSSNFFIVMDGELITPPAGDGLLPGITRKSILDFAASELVIRARARPISTNMLLDAAGGMLTNVDEAFICGTASGVVSIGSIDGNKVRDWSTMPVTRRVRECYMDHVHGKCQAHKFWLEKVYPAAKSTV